MYCAKQRALEPLLMVLLATEQLGIVSLAVFNPALDASAVMPAGVMSGVPTIFCASRLSWTVLRPLAPITMAAMPKATSTTAATMPPISNAFRMAVPFTRHWFHPVSIGAVGMSSGYMASSAPWFAAEIRGPVHVSTCWPRQKHGVARLVSVEAVSRRAGLASKQRSWHIETIASA